MILVVGATGLLGSEICRRLRGQGAAVRGLVRRTANPERLEIVREAGVEPAWGDLKDPESLRTACQGIDVVISTASSTLSRQPGDSIETVDHLGQLALIGAAREAGVGHFTLIGMPRRRARSSPLTRAKDDAERTVIDSGIPFTILAANVLMEVWLSPAVGFDFPNRKVMIFGEGRAPISWVSFRDVADFAVRSHQTPAARNRILEVGGPQDLSPVEVVGIFEQIAGAAFERHFAAEEDLIGRAESATDPLVETFAKLQLELVHGCLANTSETLRIMPLELTTVEQYARRVLGKTAVGQ